MAYRDYGVTVPISGQASPASTFFSSKVGFPPTRAFIGVELDGRSGAKPADRHGTPMTALVRESGRLLLFMSTWPNPDPRILKPTVPSPIVAETGSVDGVARRRSRSGEPRNNGECWFRLAADPRRSTGVQPFAARTIEFWLIPTSDGTPGSSTVGNTAGYSRNRDDGTLHNSCAYSSPHNCGEIRGRNRPPLERCSTHVGLRGSAAPGPHSPIRLRPWRARRPRSELVDASWRCSLLRRPARRRGG